jgi:hypothetical protein
MWKTEGIDDVKRMMNLRAADRGIEDELYYHTEAQLKAAKLAHPETPGDPESYMSKAGFKHHSARPEASPDPGAKLDADAIKGTEAALRAAGGKKITPKRMKNALEARGREC